MKKLLVYLFSITVLLLAACSIQETTCPTCYATQDASASFCQYCGTPLSGGSLNDYPYNDNPGNTWDSGNTGNTGTSSCITCADNGYNYCQGHPCLVCNGTGYHECYCGGSPYCFVCNGEYIYKCSCENGVVYYGGGYGNSYTTSDNYEACGNCENGYVECYLCKGTGTYGTYTVGGFDGNGGAEVDSVCPTCGGRKKVACNYCYGLGYR